MPYPLLLWASEWRMMLLELQQAYAYAYAWEHLYVIHTPADSVDEQSTPLPPMDFPVPKALDVTFDTLPLTTSYRDLCHQLKYPLHCNHRDLADLMENDPMEFTIAPWKAGHSLIWDATCCDTFAASNVGLASKESGSAAEAAEKRKKMKYEALSHAHHFVPVAIETTGVFGPEAKSFMKELANRVKSETKEEKACPFLI